jgi:integral membrane protein
MLKTGIGRFTIISMLEGVSLLLLVLVGVPVKYIFQDPLPVKILGPIHGGLFLLYIVMCIPVALDKKWNALTVIKLMVASIIPFGFIYVDRAILRPELSKESNITEEESETKSRKMYTWVKRIGVTGFLFFLIKGLIWIGVFAGMIKGCS